MCTTIQPDWGQRYPGPWRSMEDGSGLNSFGGAGGELDQAVEAAGNNPAQRARPRTRRRKADMPAPRRGAIQVGDCLIVVEVEGGRYGPVGSLRPHWPSGSIS